MNGSSARIAIVGAGPKGLYCLERLSSEIRVHPARPTPDIHVFEPHPTPGAGPVYDPSQPHYLRLNFANENIDAWPRGDDVEPTTSSPTFLDFLRARHPAHADPTGYAPRALVGEYLESVFSAVVSALREVTTVEIHAEPVQRVAQVDGGFEIATERRTVRCNEVLVATGHESQRRCGPSLGPYPIDRPGGVGGIGPGRAVAVQGMGLTAIDVALALTEGRGGSFEPVGRRPGRLGYRGTPLSPRVILPFSRTGRPMVPKDHPQFGPNASDLDGVDEEDAALIASLAGEPADVLATLERCIAETAARALAVAAGRSAGATACLAEHVDHLLQRRPLSAAEAVAELTRGVDVAYGRREPGPDWAVGTAWRSLYPAIVDLVATRRLDRVWPRFGRLAAEMERVAFGPPAENAARLLALVEAGVVDLSLAGGATLRQHADGFALESALGSRPVDDFVDAVLAPPGVGDDPSPLIASLLASGLARSMADAPGIEVLSDGTCVGRSGAPTVGLAAIGRPTEGCVLGNDTLSRTFHDTPGRWARAALGRLSTSKEMACR